MDKSKPLMIVIIALLVLLLGAISAASFFFIKTMGKGDNAEAASTEAPAVKLTVDQIEKVPLSSPISTNLSAGRDGVEHYVKINLAIGVNNTDKKESPKMVTSLQSNEMVVRDIILGVLRNQTYDVLTDTDGQELLKDSIKTQLQEEFNSNLIVQVYISDLAFS